MKNHFLFLLFLLPFFSYSLNPQKDYVTTPAKMGLAHLDTTLVVNDSTHLKCWALLPNPDLDKKTSIILAGGDAGNMSYSLQLGSLLSREGYTVVLFDYRGFGESSAFEMDPKQLYYNAFFEDLAFVTRYTKSKFPDHKTGIYGFSMGTIVFQGMCQHTQVDFFIADALVTKSTNLKERIFTAKQKIVKLPKSHITLPQNLHEYIGAVLVFSGSNDTFTTTEDALAFVRQNPKAILVTYHGGHGQGLAVLRKQFIRNIDIFIENV